MKRKTDQILDTILLCWGNLVVRFPYSLLLTVIILSGVSLNYTISHLGVNTDTSQMLSSDLPFQKARRRIQKSFPQDSDILLIRIDASSAERAKSAVLELARRLESAKDHVQSLYVPGEGHFFDTEGLLFLGLEDLEDLATELSRAQPFIGRLAQDFSLAGLLSILEFAVVNTDESLPIEIDPLLQKISDAVKASTDNGFYELSWQHLMYGADRVRSNRLILLKPIMDFSEVLPAEKSLGFIRKTVREVESSYPRMSIRITGEIALEHEELEGVSKGAAWAGIASLILVCLSLWFGLRSIRLVFATFISLIVGLVLTAGFAAIAVGHLNLISIAFAVLYIGLGVDYAIHLCLRFRELAEHQTTTKKALVDSIRLVGPSIILCSISTAIGLYAFIPTDYSGVSELGIIAGTGMFIGLFVTLSVVPAILMIFPDKKLSPLRGFFPEWVYFLPFDYAPIIKGFLLLMVVCALAILPGVEFDSNPVNMRDPNTESVSTFKSMLKSADDSPFALTLLAPNREAARTAAARFEQLPSVKSAVTILDFIPKNQDDKLAILEDLDLILGTDLAKFDKQSENGQNHKALESFSAKIAEKAGAAGSSEHRVYQELHHQLRRFIDKANALQPLRADALIAGLERSLLATLPISMNSIRSGLQASGFDLEGLPTEFFRRWVSDDYQYRVQILPQKDLNKPENLKEFVEQTGTLEPNLAGLPVFDQASGKAVVQAFQQAFSGSLIAIFVLLIIVLRSFKYSLLVLLPLILAGIFTGAATVLLGSPFNFANIIALPLLLGLGVDSCIHVVDRVRKSSNKGESPLKTSTARGIFFSSLTTLFSFSSLAFTPHLGTASMGLLLAVGISFTLLCILIVLPAFTKSRKRALVVGETLPENRLRGN